MSDSDEKDWVRLIAAETIVDTLIPKYHRHLSSANIVCLARPKAAKKNGKASWAKASKESPLVQALMEDKHEPVDYLIVFGKDVWDTLPPPARIALVDHELHHFLGQDDVTGEWGMEPHDIEEFAAIIKRYGPWRPDVEAFFRNAGAQLALPGLDAVDGTGASVTLTVDGNSITLPAGASALEVMATVRALLPIQRETART